VLYAQNRLMIDHLLEFMEVFSGDHEISFSATWQPLTAEQSAADVKAACVAVGVRVKAPWLAFLRRVDLVVMADHPADRERLLFTPLVPTLHIYHAISGGKAAPGGVAYRYKDCRYTRVFESSERTARRVIQENPDLADSVRTVGYLRADLLAELRSRRVELRRDLGLPSEGRVVLVQSTWGPSIMESFGEEMVAEADRVALSRGWTFVFSTHPDHWYGPWAEGHPWGGYLCRHESDRIRVIHPTVRSEPFMATCDVVLTDHTSQAVLASLAGNPMVFFDVPGAELVVDSPVWTLRENLVRMASPNELESAVDEAWRHRSDASRSRLTEDFVSFPGAAAARVRAEALELLDL
jgi:hypothetical protein